MSPWMSVQTDTQLSIPWRNDVPACGCGCGLMFGDGFCSSISSWNGVFHSPSPGPLSSITLQALQSWWPRLHATASQLSCCLYCVCMCWEAVH